MPGSASLVILVLVSACSAGRARSRTDGSVVPPGVDGGPTAFACNPTENGCYGNTWYTCGDDGVTRLGEIQCDDACDPHLQCVLCRPGSRRCDGTVSSFCATDGRNWVSGRDCTEWSSSCGADGFCTDACAEAERSASNVGCEYWPVPLANTAELDSTLFDYRVIVANPNDAMAHVRVTRNGADVTSADVPPHDLSELSLPWIDGESFGLPEGSWTSLIVSNGAYRLTSDLPVIASQFNPFEYENGGTYSYTNDATLLYPSHVLTGDYVGVSWYPLSRRTGSTGVGGSLDSLRYPGYVAVVGISAEPTRIQVSARGAVVHDPSGRIPDTNSGGSFVLMLQRGEVAHITAAIPPECDASRPGFVEKRDNCMTLPFLGETCDLFQTCREQGFDLTGSRIAADHPVAVFGGHVCTYVPTNAEACDHLEVQLPPIQSWGRSYTGAPMGDGSTHDINVVRVLPAFESTRVTVSPAQGGVTTDMLSPGEFMEFEADSPFTIEGTGAVMVAQYLRGQHASTPAAARGDPGLTVLVPAEQYRSDYTFILPSSYNASTNGQNYLLIVRPPGLALTLDGAALSGTFAPIGDREVGIVPLAGGAHAISGGDGYGLIAYGLGSFTSYCTPAGLNLEPITTLF